MNDLASRITTALFERNVNPDGGPPRLLGGDLADPDRNGIEAVIREFVNAAPQGEIGPESPDKGAEPVDVGQVGTTRPLSESSPAVPAPAKYRTMPIEPTDAILEALGMFHGDGNIGDDGKRYGEAEARRAYADVLACGHEQLTMTDEDLILSQLKRIHDLEQLVYVPGLWRCAKCKLTMVSQTLNITNGMVKANKEPQQCPNGCGPLWRVTERDAGNELADRVTGTWNDAIERVVVLCEQLAGDKPQRVSGFLAQIQADICAANDAVDLVGRAAFVRELVAKIRELKGPA